MIRQTSGFTLMSTRFARTLKIIPGGFTLIELLVVISLITTAVVFILPNLKSVREDQDLKDAAIELQSAIRTTQANATAGLQCGLTINPQKVYTNSAVDWHLTLTSTDPASYLLEPNCVSGSISVSGFPTTTFQSPSTIYISSVTIGSCTSALSSQLIFANVSSAPTFKCGGSIITSAAQASIQLKSRTTNNTQTVVVESGGRVYVTSP